MNGHVNTLDAMRVKRPMATVRRVSLFSREIIERLSVAGVEMLLERASRLSEGQIQQNRRYYGSTMLTLDVRELEGRVRDACDATTAVRLARLLQGTSSVANRVRAIAHDEACRIAQHTMNLTGVDIRFRAEGHNLFIDADVEAMVQTQSSAASAIA